MVDVKPPISVESRRKLLKGALGASGVITMGYSGGALASFNCVANVRNLTTGGPPGSTNQFKFPTAPSTSTGKWAWVEVPVKQYRQSTAGMNGVCTNSGNSGKVDGFKLRTGDTKVYLVSNPGTAVTNYCEAQSQDTGYPKKGWVLAYFDDQGNQTGVYPERTLAVEGFTPATGSCLTSLNAGLANSGTLTFGG
ncbi:MAG: hypothetical protein JNM61_13530 [Zoogloeaceae bacterium]|nr:hypothetical protein [Zoogloeaceae bacterium]